MNENDQNALTFEMIARIKALLEYLDGDPFIGTLGVNDGEYFQGCYFCGASRDSQHEQDCFYEWAIKRISLIK